MSEVSQNFSPRKYLLLGLVLHLCVPVYAVVGLGASPWWLLSNALAAGAMSALALGSGAFVRRWVLPLISLVWMLATVLLAMAWFSRGTGFDDAFFFHLRAETITTALQVYTFEMLICVGLCLAAFVWPWFAAHGSHSTSRHLLLAWGVLFIAMILAPPLSSALDYRSIPSAQAPIRELTAEQSMQSGDAVLQGTSVSAQGRPKNIVLIYAEGLEQAFFDQQRFGNMLPKLSQFASQARQFTNIQQQRGTGWTIAGLVASQCGFPLQTSHNLSNNSTMASAQRPFPNSWCLADWLKQAGYQSVFYGGADLRFAGKGNFLRTHGYQEVYGAEQLRPLLPADQPANEWGVYDDALFGLALKRIESLTAGSQPWLLTVLTVDTHFPRGDPSPSCSPFPDSKNPMAQAVYCTDQLIGQFIGKVRDLTGPEETVITVFSDHLAFRTTLQNKMKQVKDRRLTLLISDDGLEPGLDDSLGRHFDLAPTLLDLAGVAVTKPLGSGRSLVGAQVLASLSEDTVPLPMEASPSVLEQGLVLDAKALTLGIGPFSVQANQQGYPFETGMFLAIFDEQGHVLDTHFGYDFAKLLSAHEGQFVAGFSILEEGQPVTAVIGRLSIDPSTLQQRTLEQKWLLEPGDLQRLFATGKP